ncbi:recombinase family protein [Nocardiopsis sp. TNDT3]|uniref:recombinase family protein n=1 Tax=Nocardiopsis sp. TNDT3 TaxID=2249354 RepID=UPI000E3E62D6|nr:recombinase family protein [Nocardiopsis sp. TNDT3]
MPKPRVIIYVRLSRDSDASTSVASQTDACRTYAEARGWEVLFVVEDVDVSGASRLEDREGMAKVLEAMPRADYVLAAKLDRYARSVLEFARLRKKADAATVTLITADGTLSPETAEFMINVLSAFADYELHMIKTRITESKSRLRSAGRWLGGAAPYGFKTVRRAEGVYLDEDPESAAIIRDCVTRILEKGVSLTALMYELNERGVPSPADHARIRDGRKPRGTKWSTSTLRDVLTSPALRGWLLQAGPGGVRRKSGDLRPVLDERGEPQQVGPEILDADTLVSVTTKLAERSRGAGSSRSGKSVLLHVAACGVCGDPMYHSRRTYKGADSSTYVCKAGARKDGHAGNVINSRGLESTVEAEFLTVLGSVELFREVSTGGRDVSRELRETATAIDQLAGNLAALTPGGRAAKTVVTQLEALESKYAELEAEDAVPAGVEYVSTGRTIAEEWASRDTSGRNDMLREYGVNVTVIPRAEGAPLRYDAARVRVDMDGPAWWRENPEAAAWEEAA